MKKRTFKVWVTVRRGGALYHAGGLPHVTSKEPKWEWPSFLRRKWVPATLTITPKRKPRSKP